MKKASSTKWVHKTAAEVRNAAKLRPLLRPVDLPVDTSDIPEMRLTGSGESHRIRKSSVTLRLDADVVEFFRSQGPGYQTRINRVLREAISPAGNIRSELKRATYLLERIAQRIK